MFTTIDSPCLAPFDGSFRHRDFPTSPPADAPDRRTAREKLAKRVKSLDDLQRRLYARNRHALLLVFQAMDAAGKDGTIRAVMRGLNPAGCQVYSFKQPGSEDLDHDFLWRTAKCLPERGRIGVFNRSYYEEVLVVRVHPEYLDSQRLPDPPPLKQLWKERYESIRDHEKHLARNGTVILKFWLHVSREEQRRRFLSRIDEPDKNWKFSADDVHEREHWAEYMHAYEKAVAETSRPWAPWYVIPADNKDYMRLQVADIIRDNMRQLELNYPRLTADEIARIRALRNMLME